LRRLMGVADQIVASRFSSIDLGNKATIPGNPPSALLNAKGCPFKERCADYRPECSASVPAFRSLTRSQGLACHVHAPSSITSIARSA
ncbi:hypothetical protein ACQEXT_18720, partial [Vibrio sp. TRT 29B02]